MKKKIISLGVVLGAITPVFAFAAEDLFDFIGIVHALLNYVIPVLITLAVVYFIWGVIQYLISGDEEKKKTASGMITRGLIGLLIIVSFWGIIKVVSNTFLNDVKMDRPIPNL
jgi:drug/metabolite transporter (DMT)-like permease